MNKVQLLGRICHDLELKEAGENKYTRFNVAVNRRYTKEDGTREADFISAVAWNKSAETIVKHFKKGHQIGIVGRIQTGSYEKEDGSKAYTTDIIIEEFDFIEKKTEEKPAPEYTGTTQKEDDPFAKFGEANGTGIISDSDLPF